MIIDKIIVLEKREDPDSELFQDSRGQKCYDPSKSHSRNTGFSRPIILRICRAPNLETNKFENIQSAEVTVMHKLVVPTSAKQHFHMLR
jgi:hypothetical protein